MSIELRRQRKEVNRIIESNIKRGNLPSSNEFKSELEKFLQDTDLKKPIVMNSPITRGEQTSHVKYNKTFSDIEKDLSILYEAVIELQKDGNMAFSMFQLKKDSIRREIEKVISSLREKSTLLSNGNLLATAYDVLDDLEKVDLEKTNAIVDVSKKEVTIPQIKNQSFEIVSNDSHALFVPDSMRKMSKIRSIDKSIDSLNTGGRYQFELVSDNNTLTSFVWVINMNNEVKMNEMILPIITSGKFSRKIEFTPNKENWYELPYHEGATEINSDNSRVTFPEITVSQIRVTILKRENEDSVVEEGKTRYIQRFILQKPKFFVKKYMGSAIFESNYHQIESIKSDKITLNNVSISVEEDIPNQTKIEYQIGVEEGESIRWYPISPIERRIHEAPTHVNFNAISEENKTLGIPNEISKEEFRLTELDNNGIQFYEIGRIPKHNIVSSTERLYMGKDSFLVKSFKKKQEAGDKHIPGPEDWENQNILNESFIQLNNAKMQTIFDGERDEEETNYMISAGLFSETNKEVYIAKPISNEPISIFINGRMVFQGKGTGVEKLSIELLSGWNTIVIFMYTSNWKLSQGKQLDIGIDLTQVADHMFALPQSMNRVSLHDMRHNVRATNNSNYALMETDDEYIVVVNKATPGLKYEFKYRYVDLEMDSKIKFRAFLSREEESESITPKLKKYQIRIS